MNQKFRLSAKIATHNNLKKISEEMACLCQRGRHRYRGVLSIKSKIALTIRMVSSMISQKINLHKLNRDIHLVDRKNHLHKF